MLKDLGPATENDVVLAFLQAEINSDTYGPTIFARLEKYSRDRRLIDEADLTDYPTNGIRKAILADYRGFSVDQALFQGFPNDATWRRVQLDDASELKHIKHAPFPEMTGGTRLVADGVENYKAWPVTAKKIDGIIQKLQKGAKFGDMVLVEGPDGRLVIIEGNHRATAYAVTKTGNILALVGASPRMKYFHFI